MSRPTRWTGTARLIAIASLSTLILVTTIGASAAVGATTRASAAHGAAPNALTTHRSLESDLCTFPAIASEVHALPHLKGATCKDYPPASSDQCVISSAAWTSKNLGVTIEVYASCARSRLNALEGSFETEDQNSQYNSSLGIGKWSIGYWNAQYGQGELVSESKNLLVVLDGTDPYIKLGNTNGYTPAPAILGLLTKVMSFA
jgi:hypothetical protein